MHFKYIKIRNMCGSNPLQFHLSQNSDLRYNTLSNYFHIQYTLANSVCGKVSILNIRKTAKPDTMAVWHCKLDTPMQILYNSCKNTSCKILHATHAKQGATKTEQSRRNCEIKQQFLWAVTLFCNWKTKINFYGGATTNYKK